MSSSSGAAPALKPHTALDSLNDSRKVVINLLKQTQQLALTLFPNPAGRWLLHSVSDAVLAGMTFILSDRGAFMALPPQCFHSSMKVCLKGGSNDERLLRLLLLLLLQCGLLASHNGRSQGAPYHTTAGGLQGDKTTIHVCGSRSPLWHMSLCVISCSTWSTESPSMGSL